MRRWSTFGRASTEPGPRSKRSPSACRRHGERVSIFPRRRQDQSQRRPARAPRAHTREGMELRREASRLRSARVRLHVRCRERDEVRHRLVPLQSRHARRLPGEPSPIVRWPRKRLCEPKVRQYVPLLPDELLAHARSEPGRMPDARAYPRRAGAVTRDTLTSAATNEIPAAVSKAMFEPSAG